MFGLGIRYLNGWALATHPADRNRAEWPPHPDRVFMALAAAHFETDGGPEERAVLEWLQSLNPPAMSACDAIQRTAVTSYVPVNDTEISRGRRDSNEGKARRLAKIESLATLKDAKNSGLALLPEFRRRQGREFPVAIPQIQSSEYGESPPMPRVDLIWDAEISCDQRDVLSNLCAKVVSIGHSASLVQMWVEEILPKPDWIPRDSVASKHRLRISGPGRLEQLESFFKLGLRPTSSLWLGYDSPEDEAKTSVPGTCFDDNLLILQRIAGPRLGLESTLILTSALRDTVLSNYPVQPPPEWVSGHTSDGSPSLKPHLAFLPLPHVGHDYAEGHLLGAAIAIPRDILADEQRSLGGVLFDDQGLPRELVIRMGRAGVWTVRLDEGDKMRAALRSNTWTGGNSVEGSDQSDHCRWGTVTPIVLDRHPKKLGDAEESIAIACQRIGLPRPKDVILTPVSMFIGSPHARQFPLMQRKGGGSLHHTHAILTFDRHVVGPLLLGAGRYRGYGLCRPLRVGGET